MQFPPENKKILTRPQLHNNATAFLLIAERKQKNIGPHFLMYNVFRCGALELVSVTRQLFCFSKMRDFLFLVSPPEKWSVNSKAILQNITLEVFFYMSTLLSILGHVSKHNCFFF